MHVCVCPNPRRSFHSLDGRPSEKNAVIVQDKQRQRGMQQETDEEGTSVLVVWLEFPSRFRFRDRRGQDANHDGAYYLAHPRLGLSRAERIAAAKGSVREPEPNSKGGRAAGAMTMTITDCSPRGRREWGQRQLAKATRQSDAQEPKDVT